MGLGHVTTVEELIKLLLDYSPKDQVFFATEPAGTGRVVASIYTGASPLKPKRSPAKQVVWIDIETLAAPTTIRR